MRLPAAAVYLFLNLACSGAEAADKAQPQSAWMREDIAVFRDRFLAVDRSFVPRTRALAEARLSRLERDAKSISAAQFVVELCRIAALSDNGHTGCLSSRNGQAICHQWAVIDGGSSTGCATVEPDVNVPDFPTLAIGFRAFGANFNVVTIDDGNIDLLGARLQAIDGVAIEGIRRELRSFAGGPDGYRDIKAAEVLTTPGRLHAAGLGRRSDSTTYRLLTVRGESVERTFSIAAASDRPVTLHRLPDAARAPWALRDWNEPFRFRDAPEIDAIVIQLRHNVDTAAEKIADFLLRAELERAKLGRRHVVLDMRFNGGGNLMLTRDFVSRWPARTPGKFYVLTSGQTLSAAIASIAYLKQAGADRVVIVGEPVGDRLMFFSDGRPVQLPHSGLFILPAPIRMDFHNGCREYQDCFVAVSQPGRPTAPPPAGFASVERMPVSVASLDPDVAAPWTIESWLDGTDPMMEAVDALVHRASAPH